MSPKPEGLTAESGTIRNGVTTPIFDKQKEEKERQKRELGEFLRQERVFGLKQQYFNILYLAIAHVFALYATYLNIMGYAPKSTLIFEYIFAYTAGLGITVGCHRFWTHKTFKAKLPLQYFMMILQTISNQYSIYKWSLDHRIHHKYTDTNSDPHNASRGFWFSHIGWLLLPKHPELKEKLKTFDMPDLENDPVVRFQSKWYWSLVAVFNYALPISLLYFLYDVPLLYCVAANYRKYVVSLHFTWTVNSVAHIWGEKPYDKAITPTENPFVAILAIGEGWHNYHHTFPWDYKASEWGWKLNTSTMFIDCCAYMGWAYDLKTVSRKMINERKMRTGGGDGKKTDGNDEDFDYSVPSDVTELMKKSVDEPLWGWDDERIPDDFRKMTKILRPEGK